MTRSRAGANNQSLDSVLGILGFLTHLLGMNRPFVWLTALAALSLGGCASDDLSPVPEPSAAVHRSAPPTPSGQFQRGRAQDEFGWPTE
jgi:hypothetical protein